MSTEPLAVTLDEFARLLGMGPRKFRDALRAGSIPEPLNPAAAKPEQYRWGKSVVQAFAEGKYKGPLLAAGVAPAPRAVKPVENPRGPRTANKEAAGPQEGRVPLKRVVIDLSKEDFGDQSKVVVMMPDGTMQTLNLKN